MKNIPKAGLLIITLVIPALIFLFLQLFGTNHYNLPYLNPVMGANGRTLVVNGDTVYQRVSNFCPGIMTEGKLIVMNFLPKVCDDSCDLVNAGLRRIASLADNIPTLQIVTLAEPGSEAAEIGKGSESDIWRVQNASEEQTNGCFAAAAFTSVEEKCTSISKENRIILIDGQGYSRGYYDGAKEAEIDRLMAEIKILDYEKKKSGQN